MSNDYLKDFKPQKKQSKLLNTKRRLLSLLWALVFLSAVFIISVMNVLSETSKKLAQIPDVYIIAQYDKDLESKLEAIELINKLAYHRTVVYLIAGLIILLLLLIAWKNKMH